MKLPGENQSPAFTLRMLGFTSSAQPTLLPCRLRSLVAAKIHQKTLVHRGRVFDFTLERITLENDETVDSEVIRHPGAAAIVAMPDSDNP